MAAAKKAVAKSRAKGAARKSTKAPAKTKAKARTKAAAKTPGRRQGSASQSDTATRTAVKNGQGGRSVGGKLGIRVRMYRIGFGDFFLLTVPGNDGPAHILIDCGVHAANIGSIGACVQDLKKTTNNRLALVILTL